MLIYRKNILKLILNKVFVYSTPFSGVIDDFEKTAVITQCKTGLTLGPYSSPRDPLPCTVCIFSYCSTPDPTDKLITKPLMRRRWRRRRARCVDGAKMTHCAGQEILRTLGLIPYY